MDAKDVSINTLIEKIENNEILLPEMQRDYVWRKEQVSTLLDSIYRDYPSGTILTWETNDKIPVRDFATKKQIVESDDERLTNFELLLDGQQRLTSLSAILRGNAVRVKGVAKPIDILFNFAHDDVPEFVTEIDEYESEENNIEENDTEESKKAFAVSNKKLVAQPYWISVTDFFKNPDSLDILEKSGIETTDASFRKYFKRLEKLSKIGDYKYRVATLERQKKYKYEEVAEIFVRVNSKGTMLKGSDLALAQITAKWRGSLKIFQEFEEKCKSSGFNFEVGTHLRSMVAIATGQCKFNIVGSLTKQELEEAWEMSKGATEFAMNFFKNNAGIDSPALLSSSFLLISVGYYGYKNNYKFTSEDSEKLKNWVLIANAKGHYSRGSTESILDQDLGIINKGTNSIIEDLLKSLKNQVGKFDIDASELEELKSNSAYFKAMFMKFRKMEARDWISPLNIEINNKGARHKIEFHHIFPKDVLAKHGIKDSLKVNNIANLAFIESATNKIISNKVPIKYIKLFKDYEELFSQQCIPYHKFGDNGNIVEENYYLKIENYEEFLKERRRLIADCLNEFLGLGN